MLALLFGTLIHALAVPAAAQGSVTIGLDHIPVAVRDLERASATYRALGFVVKAGRNHANGIRNAHVKFPDGSGIEILTAPNAVDALSTHYVDELRAGEGPVFLSFHARDTERFHAALRQGGHEFRQDGEITDLRVPELAYLFVVRDNRSPTDRAEHFAHPNGAAAMSAVWVAPENGGALARFLVQLGGRQQHRQVLAPDPVKATVIILAEGEVFILPKSHQILAGRPVIGASFRVSDLTRLQPLLDEAQIRPWAGAGTGERVVIEAGVA